MSRVQRMPAAARRDQLLAAALARFAATGFRDTSMDDIAEEAGVTKPVLYQHFPSKRTLYLELLDTVGADMVQRIAARVAAATTPQRRVLAGFEAYFRFVCEATSSWQLLFSSAARQGDDFADAVERLEQTVATMIGGLIDAAIDDEHRRLLGYGVVGVAEVTARQWVARSAKGHGAPPGLDPAEAGLLARRLADMVWAGLRALPGALAEAAGA
ncbi:MAG TPA: TetR/AcrR family transcriptional regulator [Acidimicrobiales bacterium]|nr:TetR/AcrR family transcriptional regulator [Acidimicrobiales bacterium]